MKIFQFIIKGKTGLKDYYMVRELNSLETKVTTRAKEKEDNNIPISNFHH